jgi:signal transduction histidine kinase
MMNGVGSSSIRIPNSAPASTAALSDDADARRTLESAADFRRFEKLLLELSASFVNVRTDEIDSLIESGLRKLGQALGIDRCSFAEFDALGREMFVTHSYVAAGIPELPREIVDDQFPWYARQIRYGRPVRIERIPEELPEEAVKERAYCVAVGMKSNLAIPLSVDDRFGCVLTFATFRDRLVWSDDLVDRLWLIGEVFANAIGRRRQDETTQKLRDQLIRIGRVTLMGELAGAIAHEMNQPLCAILTNSRIGHRLAQAGEAAPEEIAEIFGEIAAAGRRASDIVERIRGMIGNRPRRSESVSLSEAVDEVFSLVAGQTVAKGVTLRKRIDASAPATMICDRVQLHQVLMNLVLNAIDAVENACERQVDVEATTISGADGRRETSVSVRDTGGGISPDVIDRIFEPFFTTKPNGIGAGLSICRSIIEAHGGRIWAESAPGCGATVRFTLPQSEFAT